MGAWIEIKIGKKNFEDKLVSHPLWVRGLKCWYKLYGHKKYLSHPLWVRGLKSCPQDVDVPFTKVAPFMGAWIEILGNN